MKLFSNSRKYLCTKYMLLFYEIETMKVWRILSYCILGGAYTVNWNRLYYKCIGNLNHSPNHCMCTHHIISDQMKTVIVRKKILLLFYGELQLSARQCEKCVKWSTVHWVITVMTRYFYQQVRGSLNNWTLYLVTGPRFIGLPSSRGVLYLGPYPWHHAHVTSHVTSYPWRHERVVRGATFWATLIMGCC